MIKQVINPTRKLNSIGFTFDENGDPEIEAILMLGSVMKHFNLTNDEKHRISSWFKKKYGERKGEI